MVAAAAGEELGRRVGLRILWRTRDDAGWQRHAGPDYDTWPNLCDANLQKRIEIGALGPEDLLKKLKTSQPLPEHILPDDFGQFWIDAFADAYGPLTPNGPVSLVSLNHAYLMTWLVLWF